MTRDTQADAYCWDKWVEYGIKRIETIEARCREPFGDPKYRPQYLVNLSRVYLHLTLRSYSRGDAVGDLSQYFVAVLVAREESDIVGTSVYTLSSKQLDTAGP